MTATPQQILEAHKAQVDGLHAWGNAWLQTTEKLSQLNLASSRVLVDESAGLARTLLAAKDPQEFAALAHSSLQPAVEKFTGYARNANAIVSTASAELAKLVEAQVAAGNRQLAEVIDLAAKTAPAGSEHAISLIKNSLSAANTAFDIVAKATRKAAEAAEASICAVVAVASDTVKARPKNAAWG